MSEFEDCIGMGTFVGNDLDAGVERLGWWLWLGESEDEANEGLVTVGSRNEKKLCDNECLCYPCQLPVP